MPYDLLIDLYSLAIYNVFPLSLTIFIAGSTYRLFRYLRFWRRGPRPHFRNRGILGRIKGLALTFIEPLIDALKYNKLDLVFGLTFLHVLGLIPLIFLFSHHVVFFEYIFPPYSLLWPLAIPLSPNQAYITEAYYLRPLVRGIDTSSIWGPLTILLNADFLTVLSMAGVTFKIGDKIVKKMKGIQHIRIGDFAALILLFLILLFGFLAAHHLPSNDVVTYRAILGTHILLAEALLAILPFTKFWHFMFGYWYGKLHEWYDLRVKRGAE